MGAIGRRNGLGLIRNQMKGNDIEQGTEIWKRRN